MKIDKLSGKNIRTSDSAPNITTLDDAKLKNVVGGDAGIFSTNCEIHFYYPADAVV